MSRAVKLLLALALLNVAGAGFAHAAARPALPWFILGAVGCLAGAVARAAIARAARAQRAEDAEIRRRLRAEALNPYRR